MMYLDRIRTAGADPEALEQTYRSAVQSGEEPAFTDAVEAAYAAAPDDVLLGAWHYRLTYDMMQAAGRSIPWLAAILLAAANGMLFWWLSAEQFWIAVGGEEDRKSVV